MNIAQSQERIKELNRQREELYKLKIRIIDKEIEELQLNIMNRCSHPEEYLLVTIIPHIDEYDQSITALQEQKIKCVTCNKEIYIRSSYINKYKSELSTLFQIPENELKDLR